MVNDIGLYEAVFFFFLAFGPGFWIGMVIACLNIFGSVPFSPALRWKGLIFYFSVLSGSF